MTLLLKRILVWIFAAGAIIGQARITPIGGQRAPSSFNLAVVTFLVMSIVTGVRASEIQR